MVKNALIDWRFVPVRKLKAISRSRERTERDALALLTHAYKLDSNTGPQYNGLDLICRDDFNSQIAVSRQTNLLATSCDSGGEWL